MERCMVECLSLSAMHGEEVQHHMTELCSARPRLGAFLFPFADDLLMQEEETDAVERFLEESLQSALMHLDTMESAWIEKSLAKVVEHLLEASQAVMKEESKFGALCLKAVPLLLERCDIQPKNLSDCLMQSINNLQPQRATAEDLKPLSDELEQLSSALLDTNSPSGSFGWLSLNCTAAGVQEIAEKTWLECLNATTDVLHSTSDSVPVELRQMTHDCFGWALSQVHSPFHKCSYPLEEALLQSITHLLFQTLSTAAQHNTNLFYTIIAVLHSILHQIKSTQMQGSLLGGLEDASFYQQAVAAIKSLGAPVVEWASRGVIRVMNGLMACGPVHDGTVSDKGHEEEHLSAWMQQIFPWFVLFPETTLHHIVMNAILYDAPQRLLIQSTKRLAPTRSARHLMLFHSFSQAVTEMDSLPAENLCSFVHGVFDEADVVGVCAFLERICAERFTQWRAPGSTTTEGLLKGALKILEARKSENLLTPSCLRVMESLMPILSFSAIPGNASDPTFAETAISSKLLFDLCLELLNESDHAAQSMSQCLEKCASLPWHMRIRYLPLVSPSSSTHASLFLPDSQTQSLVAEEALAWMHVMSEMLWFGSVSEFHLAALCSSLQGLHTDSCVESLAGAFVDEVMLMPEELRSWVLVMAMAEIVCTCTAPCLERVVTTLLPSLLPHFAPADDDRNSCHSLIVELLCRTVYVIGAHSDICEAAKSGVLRQGQICLARFCLDTLDSLPVDAQESFVLHVFLEVSTLMTSMTGSSYDCTDLHVVLAECLKALIGMAVSVEEGMVLPSGVSLRLVMEWMVVFVERTPPESKNHVLLAMNALIRNKLR